ncbi:MAG: hypothetical protein UT53_C0009G0001 [Candidatus Yanofskybacteria bacterium GW2011_GWD2_39_48]|uniref:26 kDa periplasmic immunogenic protein n=1 Tax=Candidatus Yanofskybacteria bacterium GW2011_GWD2_39_48 TaxID=1619031 RepID=A0A0G0SDH0_9BACT|nr:MAG: hypothetical protein UT53_C0009G0001 [Candidatus Yanofskybacteria bacterium GW2011_GWD2_39_48]
MNNPFKPLILVGTIVLVVLAIFLLAKTNQTLNTAATTNTVSFAGEGKVSAKPDIAIISASIVTQAVDSKSAQNDNSTKSTKVTEFLKQQKVEDKDIKTSGYNIYPQQKYPPYGGQPTITGYQVTRDLGNIGTVLSGLVSAGANQVSNLGLQVENPEALRDEARQKAIVDAKQKAKTLEKQVGISLGKVVNFTENTGGYPYPMMYESKAMGMGGGGVTPDVPVGENEITISVSLTYQIK